ncbi:hypothetical protein C8F01DRAFT_216949 [Mycena amicta]|nr:hypothetical protein C8F01DRAFT_216949 [Mycena amicta]
MTTIPPLHPPSPMRTVALLALVASASVVAQSSSATESAADASPSISPCILDCLTTAGTASPCMTFTNVTCACTDDEFQKSTAACIMDQCPDEMEAGQELQDANCGADESASASATAASTSITDLATSEASTPHVVGSTPSLVGASSSASASASASVHSSFGTTAFLTPRLSFASASVVLAVLLGAAVVL